MPEKHTIPSPTVARISVERLRRNTRRLQERAAPAQLMAVIKANAYGHGARRVASVLVEEGVSNFAVARIDEGADLRNAGVTEDILVLGSPLTEHLPLYLEYDLSVTVASPVTAQEVIDLARSDQPIKVHVNIDTGMGRLGLSPGEAGDVLRVLRKAPGVQVAGLWTHFAQAGTPEADDFTHGQLREFTDLLASLPSPLPPLHVANSSAIIRQFVNLPSNAGLLARAGLALFGIGETPELGTAANLEPVMQLVSHITQLKTVKAGTPISYGCTWHAPERTCIATVAAGYADGYMRLLSNRADVTICGERYPVAGIVCMDMFMVNLGPPQAVPQEISRGTPVYLFGPGGPSVHQAATWAETIPYELCCNVGHRVPYEYIAEFNEDVTI